MREEQSAPLANLSAVNYGNLPSRLSAFAAALPFVSKSKAGICNIGTFPFLQGHTLHKRLMTGAQKASKAINEQCFGEGAEVKKEFHKRRPKIGEMISFPRAALGKRGDRQARDNRPDQKLNLSQSIGLSVQRGDKASLQAGRPLSEHSVHCLQPHVRPRSLRNGLSLRDSAVAEHSMPQTCDPEPPPHHHHHHLPLAVHPLRQS
ncbi:hypothetical protein NQZ68_033468 [Dissostichus eleginoides]|nr:hypothetical protein NQZ68_033468 [Dissostichus eleginoides]